MVENTEISDYDEVEGYQERPLQFCRGNDVWSFRKAALVSESIPLHLRGILRISRQRSETNLCHVSLLTAERRRSQSEIRVSGADRLTIGYHACPVSSPKHAPPSVNAASVIKERNGHTRKSTCHQCRCNSTPGNADGDVEAWPRGRKRERESKRPTMGVCGGVAKTILACSQKSSTKTVRRSGNDNYGTGMRQKRDSFAQAVIDDGRIYEVVHQKPDGNRSMNSVLTALDSGIYCEPAKLNGNGCYESSKDNERKYLDSSKTNKKVYCESTQEKRKSYCADNRDAKTVCCDTIKSTRNSYNGVGKDFRNASHDSSKRDVNVSDRTSRDNHIAYVAGNDNSDQVFSDSGSSELVSKSPKATSLMKEKFRRNSSGSCITVTAEVYKESEFVGMSRRRASESSATRLLTQDEGRLIATTQNGDERHGCSVEFRSPVDRKVERRSAVSPISQIIKDLSKSGSCIENQNNSSAKTSKKGRDSDVDNRYSTETKSRLSSADEKRKDATKEEMKMNNDAVANPKSVGCDQGTTRQLLQGDVRRDNELVRDVKKSEVVKVAVQVRKQEMKEEENSNSSVVVDDDSKESSERGKKSVSGRNRKVANVNINSENFDCERNFTAQSSTSYTITNKESIKASQISADADEYNGRSNERAEDSLNLSLTGISDNTETKAVHDSSEGKASPVSQNEQTEVKEIIFHTEVDDVKPSALTDIAQDSEDGDKVDQVQQEDDKVNQCPTDSSETTSSNATPPASSIRKKISSHQGLTVSVMVKNPPGANGKSQSLVKQLTDAESAAIVVKKSYVLTIAKQEKGFQSMCATKELTCSLEKCKKKEHQISVTFLCSGPPQQQWLPCQSVSPANDLRLRSISMPPISRQQVETAAAPSARSFSRERRSKERQSAKRKSYRARKDGAFHMPQAVIDELSQVLAKRKRSLDGGTS